MSELDIEALKRLQRAFEDTRYRSDGDSQLAYFKACDELESSLSAIIAALERSQRLEERLRELHGRIAEALEE